jgi:RNA polymerase sigma-70 factor (ECF subfamily)
LLRLLCVRTGDASEAEDIMQDLWLKAHAQQVATLSNGKAYLYRMAQNLLIDRLRERHRRMCRDYQWVSDFTLTHAGTGGWHRSAEDAAHEQEETQRLMRAIEKLPEGARSVFRLHKLEGLSHAEVASRLAISRSGVEKHIAVAMKCLRRALLN